MPERQIVPFGGMRPTTDGSTHHLITWLLDLTEKPRAKVCNIATATGDATETLARYYERIPAARAERTHLALFNRTVRDITSFLCEQDVIFVGGGNTVSLLAVWRAHGVDTALRAAWEAGVILTGGSAGSLCWFECGTTDSYDLFNLEPLHDGLGFLPGSHCPHYDGEVQRRPLYHRLIGEGFPAGYAIDDDAAIRFIGSEVGEVVSARDGATAYRVEKVGDQVIETPLTARSLR
ncbi:MAG TPA: peptidase E [Actinomycetota bacterium]